MAGGQVRRGRTGPSTLAAPLPAYAAAPPATSPAPFPAAPLSNSPAAPQAGSQAPLLAAPQAALLPAYAAAPPPNSPIAPPARSLATPLTLLVMTAGMTGAPLSGQVSGVVEDGAGHPVASALVELLAADSVVRRTEADARGWFDLRPTPTATHVRASRFGFEPAVVPLGDLMRPLRVTLPPRAFQLTGIRVDVVERQCPASSDPEAKAWLLARLARGAVVLEAESWAGPLEELRSGGGLFREDIRLEPREIGHGEQGGGTPVLRLWMSEVRSGTALARRRQTGEMGGDGMVWRLGGFHGSGAASLALPGLFDDAEVAWVEAGGGVVACLGQSNGASLLATFRGDDHGIRDVSWRIRTEDPVEMKGGHLELVEGDLLLPRRSYVWVREADGRTRTDLAVFGPWFVGTREEVRRGVREYVSGRRPPG